MKKLYSVVLCMAVALYASAQQQTLSLDGAATGLPTAKTANKAFKQSGTAMDAELNPGKPTKAPAKIAAIVDDVIGDYEVSYYVELQNGGPYANEMKVTAGTLANTVVLNIPFVNGTSVLTWRVTGTLDPATGDITILANQASGFTGASVTLKHYNWDEKKYETLDQIIANFDGKAIVFDEDDAMGLQAASGGYYTLFDMITMDKIAEDPNADPNEGWTSIGQATLIDPWLMPCIGMDQYENPWKVELQQNDDDENLYRLVDPYFGVSPLARYNQSTAKHGYIQFNISDPDHVMFDSVEAGFANSSVGITKFYPNNMLLYYYLALGEKYTPATIVSALGDELIYTTYADGVVTLGSREETDDDGNTETVYDAGFGFQGAIASHYSWIDEDEKTSDMSGKIIFPETSFAPSIIGEENAPVEYYNLQGIRVTEHKPGQVVIRRQGSESKLIYTK